jgi:hypothetical protein
MPKSHLREQTRHLSAFQHFSFSAFGLVLSACQLFSMSAFQLLL